MPQNGMRFKRAHDCMDVVYRAPQGANAEYLSRGFKCFRKNSM